MKHRVILLGLAVAVAVSAAVTATLLMPNSTQGDGWRLLTEQLGGEPFRAVAAIDTASLASIAEELQLSSMTGVDFDEEVVVAFTVVTSSGLLGCEPIGFRGLVVEGGVVAGSYRRPYLRIGCKDNALLTTFVVAVDRDLLPADGFELKLFPEAPSAIRVDLQNEQ